MLIFFCTCSCADMEPDWNNYDPALKKKIDSYDCSDLQNVFDIAAANSSKQDGETDQGHAKLMHYIDKKRKEKSCH